MKEKLTIEDFRRAATRLGCEVAAIQAVAQVESAQSGFYADGFPVILFERHLFRKWTQGRFSRQYPELSGAQGNYGAAGANQRRKFNLAFALNPEAAMKSCSWGKFQILGENYAVCGYNSVGEFVDAMKESEGKHLDAFVEFVIHNGLAHHLRDKNWASFARGYNGRNYSKNAYDVKMARAYKKFVATQTDSADDATPATQPATQDPPDSEIPPSSADKLVETTTVETSDGTTTAVTTAPSNMVAVEKEEPPKGFWADIKAKVMGWWATIGGTAAMRQYQDDIASFGIPVTLIKYAVFVVLGGFLIWLLYHALIHLWTQYIAPRLLTMALVKANANLSDTTTVSAIAPERLAELEAQGYTIVRRK